MVIKLNNGQVYVVRELKDFEEIVEPEVYAALCELVQDKSQTEINYDKMAEALLR